LREKRTKKTPPARSRRSFRKERGERYTEFLVVVILSEQKTVLFRA